MKIKKSCSLCQWSTPRFAKDEMWCDANGTVVRPGWRCLSFTKSEQEQPLPPAHPKKHIHNDIN